MVLGYGLLSARPRLIKLIMPAVNIGKRKSTWYFLFIAVWVVVLAFLWSSRVAETRAKHGPEASVESVLENMVVEEVRMETLLDGGSLHIELIGGGQKIELTTTPGTDPDPLRVRHCVVNGVTMPDFEESWPDYRSRLITRLRWQLDRPDAVAPRGLADVLKLLQEDAARIPVIR